jgi:hypothetical protein
MPIWYQRAPDTGARVHHGYGNLRDDQEADMVRILGMILIAVGLAALALGGITYTRREKVVDIGPIEATAERRERIPLSPIAGGAAVAAGVALLVFGGKTKQG